MKKIFLFIIISVFTTLSALAVENNFDTPVPSADDEVTYSGPDTKFTTATQMRYDAFENAETVVVPDFSEDKKFVPIYKLSKNQDYLQRIKIINAKVTEFTNGTYFIKFKDTPFTIFYYNKDGSLNSFAKITNKGKVPFSTYIYDIDGNLSAIEIKPQRYRSYVYDLNGVLLKYSIDDKVYAPNGKMLLRKKSALF